MDDAGRKWGHDQLMHDLASHLRGNTERMVWENMQLGASGSPRPDVYTLDKSYSRWNPLAYECKVTMADFRSDITSGKWQRYLDFARGVIFAVPAGLISKDDVPKGCGLIVRHENVWRAVRKPTLQPLDTLDRDAWMKLLIDGVDRCHAARPGLRKASEYHAAELMREKVGADVAMAYRNHIQLLASLQYRIEQATEKLEKIDEQVAEREQRALGQARVERAEITAMVEAHARELGCHASVWAIRKRLDEIRPARDREAIADAVRALEQVAESTKKAAIELAARSGVEQC